jgi:hypothetical protein
MCRRKGTTFIITFVDVSQAEESFFINDRLNLNKIS